MKDARVLHDWVWTFMIARVRIRRGTSLGADLSKTLGMNSLLEMFGE